MTTMIERVARAMATKDNGDDIAWKYYQHLARAAVEAMREPTEAMVLANSDAAGPDDQQTIADWQAMIDAALKETP